MPDTFQIISIKGSSIEAKRNSDGIVVFRDASHFKAYIEEIIRWSMLSYETQKVAQQQEAKLHQCQM